jgi:hypothetical protein
MVDVRPPVGVSLESIRDAHNAVDEHRALVLESLRAEAERRRHLDQFAEALKPIEGQRIAIFGRVSRQVFPHGIDGSGVPVAAPGPSAILLDNAELLRVIGARQKDSDVQYELHVANPTADRYYVFSFDDIENLEIVLPNGGVTE